MTSPDRPIRASTIDGHKVDDYAGKPPVPLRIESVVVPHEAIARACGLVVPRSTDGSR